MTNIEGDPNNWKLHLIDGGPYYQRISRANSDSTPYIISRESYWNRLTKCERLDYERSSPMGLNIEKYTLPYLWDWYEWKIHVSDAEARKHCNRNGFFDHIEVRGLVSFLPIGLDVEGKLVYRYNDVPFTYKGKIFCLSGKLEFHSEFTGED